MIKVGDWVKREHADGIARVISIEEDMAVLYTGGVQSCEYLEELTKLPIKFKGFSLRNDMRTGVSEVRRIKGMKHPYWFYAYGEEGNVYAWYKPYTYKSEPEDSKKHLTADQARDWLELQYATMLAKARGLV